MTVLATTLASRRLLAAEAAIILARRDFNRAALNAAYDEHQSAQIAHHVAFHEARFSDYIEAAGADAAREAAYVNLHREGMGGQVDRGPWVWAPHNTATIREWAAAWSAGDLPPGAMTARRRYSALKAGQK